MKNDKAYLKKLVQNEIDEESIYVKQERIKKKKANIKPKKKEINTKKGSRNFSEDWD